MDAATKLRGIDHLFKAFSKASPAQQEMLRALGEIQQPVTTAELADRLNLHPNTVREVLDNLVELGLVKVGSRPPAGRGRPAKLYELAAPIDASRFYHQLSRFLISTAKVTAASIDDPDAFMREVGREWGRTYLRSFGIPDHSEFTQLFDDADLRRYTEKVRMMMVLGGFQSTLIEDGTKVEITTCPYLVENDAAVQDLICTLHGAVMEEVVGTLSRGRLTTTLCPFATSAGCTLSVKLQAQTDEVETSQID